MGDMDIACPNLGIYLRNVPKTIMIGNFGIALYGIVIGLGMILGLSLAARVAKKTGTDPDVIWDLAAPLLIFGIMGARIYYVIFMWDYYKDNPAQILNIRGGGLAIYGGIIAGVLAIYVLSRVKHIPFPRVLDTCVIGVPIGQILGRWGNFFNREAFGGYTDNLLAMQLPVSAVRSHEITAEMRSHAEIIGGVEFIRVHPTFLYEGLWNCLVLLLLFLVRNKTKFEGELFLIYLAGYGTGRFFIEMLRTDQLLVPGTQIPVSMLLSAVLVLVSVILIIRGHLKNKMGTNL